MSAVEIKERLTEFINTKDEGTLTRLWWAAEDIEAETADSRNYETAEFFREMDEDCEAVASGKERDFSHKEAMDILRNRKPIP